ncbi:MAG: 4-(cytidine 5'-diphospho)-2-C-methyl-D-erythritol kinase [Eubacterium sp.]|nr:4-(cytidine 5'-diphospho)-2-C-methyl-D-erythritol kinase [Eubacterium sp.]
MTKKTVTKKAYAKVNLGLDIVGLRGDGYHLVKMIMQTIDLFDVLTFQPAERPGIFLKISEKSTIPDVADVPTDGRNLIVKAAGRILEKTGIPEAGVEILLEKHIPMAAGMAGGSTDCAAALRGVAELMELDLGEKELAEIGVSLGADVPYCLMGGTALSEGIGEVLTPLPALPPCGFLIVKPEFGASTKEVYGAYDRLMPEEIRHPDIDGMTEALKQGDLSGVAARLGNVLEPVTVAMHPQIRTIEDLIRRSGVKDTIMTGSGPTVFGILPETIKDAEHAAEKSRCISEIKEQLKDAGIPAQVLIV